MAHGSGDSFYDDDDVQKRYTAHRDGEQYLSPNYVMEEPAVLSEVGDPAGLRILDLGCGDARFGRTMLMAGARSYHGVDSSARMVETAKKNLAGTGGSVMRADIEAVDPPADSVDLVTARLSLHYVAEIGHIMDAAARALVTGGRLIFTVLHPVITSYDSRPSGPRTNWTVDDYFNTGPRRRDWLGSKVTWHHRTVQDYVMAVTDAGLTLTTLRECEPDRARFDGHADEFVRRQRVPLFLLLSGRN